MPFGREDGFATRLAHGQMEARFGEDASVGAVLEVGAGDGLHLPFVRHQYDEYWATDVSHEAVERAKERWGSLKAVTFAVVDGQSLPFDDGRFDRVIATCVLMHLADPEGALQEWRRVARRPGGVVTVYVPHEAGVLLRFGRMLTTARAVKKSGFEGYDLLLAREHRNYSRGLDVMIRYVFRADRLVVQGWPLKRGPLAGRVFTVYHAIVGE